MSVTLADPAPAQVTLRQTALAHYAMGRTAAGRRALAAIPVVVEAYAALYGVTPEVMRTELLAIAGGIDEITAEGLSRVSAWYLAGLDQFHGFYPGTPAAALVPVPRGEEVSR